MHKLFTILDSKVRLFRQWAKKHRGLGIVAYIFIFALLWPIIVAYLISSFANKKLGLNVVTKTLAVGLIGFGTMFNAAWVYGIANPQPVEKKPVTQTAQAPPQQNEQEQEASEPEQPKVELYKVVEVVDGDTVKVDYNGKTETVRLIGVDTPEVVDPRTTVQCFGEEASIHARTILSGKSVKLEADSTQSDRDKYSRLLRYVFLEDGTNFNKRMIADGYAYEYTYEVPYKYQQEFKTAQTEAQNGSKGLWAANTCSGQRTKPQPVVTPAPTTQQSTDCKIKGNIASDGEKIYHMPGQRYYDKTIIDTSKGERWFCSETEAVNAGWRKSKV